MPDSEMSAEILMDDELRDMLKDLAVPFELRKAIVRYGAAARQQGIEDAASRIENDDPMLADFIRRSLSKEEK